MRLVLSIWEHKECVKPGLGCTESLKTAVKLNILLSTIRIITGYKSGTSHSQLYGESGFCTLKERMKRHKRILYFTMIDRRLLP